MAKRAPRPGEGRPTIFNEKMALEICTRIASGESLKRICEDDAMPSRDTVHVWLLDGKHKEFSDSYEKACNTRAENMFDELVEIADDGSNDYMEVERQDGSVSEVVNTEHIQRSRLRVDTRKWYLSKVLPKKYGEKVDVTSGGEQIKGNVIVFSDFSDGTEDK